MATTLRLLDVHYRPGTEPVTLACLVLDGPFVGTTHLLDTTQTALAARAGVPDWGDAAALAEGVAVAAAQGLDATIVTGGA